MERPVSKGEGWRDHQSKNLSQHRKASTSCHRNHPGKAKRALCHRPHDEIVHGERSSKVRNRSHFAAKMHREALAAGIRHCWKR